MKTVTLRNQKESKHPIKITKIDKSFVIYLEEFSTSPSQAYQHVHMDLREAVSRQKFCYLFRRVLNKSFTSILERAYGLREAVHPWRPMIPAQETVRLLLHHTKWWNPR